MKWKSTLQQAAFGILLTCATELIAKDEGNAKLSAKAERTVKLLKQQIQTEISQLKNHPWAGEYYEGDGLGVNVSLAIVPKHGYVFEWRGCLGLYDRNYGNVTVTNGRIQLAFTFTNRQHGFQGIADELIPVPWGKRKYLVPAKNFIGFCNEVNSGSEPRKGLHGRFLLRCGDEKIKVTGTPTIPNEYKRCLLKQPVEAVITKIGKTSTRPSKADFNVREACVTINAGAKHNLQTGMELYVSSPHTLVETVELTTVAETESEGVISQIIFKDEPEPQVGWKLSTRAPWHLNN